MMFYLDSEELKESKDLRIDEIISSFSELDKAYMELQAKFGDEAVDYVKSIDASAETIKNMIKRGRIY